MKRCQLAIKRVFQIVIVVASTWVFARFPVSNVDTLFTVKLYSEPQRQQGLKLKYNITSLDDVYYSYYHGSDLPTWRFIKKKTIQGEFNSVELVNVRAHAQKKASCNRKVHLSIIEPKSKRTVWDGYIGRRDQHSQITVVTKADNKKEFDTQIKIDGSMGAVLFEFMEK